MSASTSPNGGVIAPFEHGLKLNANKPVTFRYRLVISKGPVDAKRLADRKADFASITFEPR